MSAGNQPSTAPNPEETFNDLLTYAALLNTPRLARLHILQHGPVEIETIKSDLEIDPKDRDPYPVENRLALLRDEDTDSTRAIEQRESLWIE